MIAAQCEKSILAPFVFEGTADTKLFEGWVEKCLLPELKPGNVIIMDNYIIHKSKKIQDLIESAGCKILFLPPYSPDLNPIENYWAVIKSRIKKLKRTCDDFQKAIDLAFRQNY